MKKFIFLLLSIPCALTATYAQATLTDDDKAAILAVIEQDTRCYYSNDYDCWLECWSQHPQTSAIVTHAGVVYERVSWQVWSEGVQGDMRNRTAPDLLTTRRENFIFIPLGDQTVVCHFDAYSIREKACSYSKEIRVMQKEASRWKITFMSALTDDSRKCAE